MEFSTSTWMLIAFVAGMILSIWKMYPFLVNRTLEDDDTGEDTHNLLVQIMQNVLQELEEAPDAKTLHAKMKQHKDFDEKKLWRFNLNKLNQLLHIHYAKNPDVNSIEDIHQKLKKR
jgi:hypothetical protein